MTTCALVALIFLACIGRGTTTHHNLGGQTERRNLAAEPAVELEEIAAKGLSDSARERPAGDELAYRSCPEGYPAFGKLGELMRAWSPNDPDVPEGVVIERLHVSFDMNLQQSYCTNIYFDLTDFTISLLHRTSFWYNSS